MRRPVMDGAPQPVGTRPTVTSRVAEAVGAVGGASFAGEKAMTATSGSKKAITAIALPEGIGSRLLARAEKTWIVEWAPSCAASANVTGEWATAYGCGHALGRGDRHRQPA